MGDELLEVLNQQLQEERVKLLHDRRMEAYKFLDSAYRYVQERECVAEGFDAWELKLRLALNHLRGLSHKSDRDDLLKEIAEIRWIVDQRINSNPHPTEAEYKLFQLVESFKVTV